MGQRIAFQEGSEDLVTPVVGKAPEGRGTLLASQTLNFNGSDGTTAADVPGAKATQEDARRSRFCTTARPGAAVHL